MTPRTSVGGAPACALTRREKWYTERKPVRAATSLSGRPVLREQVDGERHAPLPQVRDRRRAKLGAESAHEVGGADVGGGRDLREVEPRIPEPIVDRRPRARDCVAQPGGRVSASAA